MATEIDGQARARGNINKPLTGDLEAAGEIEDDIAFDAHATGEAEVGGLIIASSQHVVVIGAVHLARGLFQRRKGHCRQRGIGNDQVEIGRVPARLNAAVAAVDPGQAADGGIAGDADRAGRPGEEVAVNAGVAGIGNYGDAVRSAGNITGVLAFGGIVEAGGAEGWVGGIEAVDEHVPAEGDGLLGNNGLAKTGLAHGR